MKHLLKLTSLVMAMFLLAGCTQNGGDKKETTQEATTEATTQASEKKDEKAEDSKEADKDKKDKDATDKEDSTQEGDEADKESTEEDKDSEAASEDAVSFKFFVNGQEQTDLAFTVEDADGMSVLEVLEAQEDLDFNFNEEEGIVDTINGVSNNYGTWETWTYLLNGQFAELGVVSQTLSPGDEIEWYYGTTDAVPVNIIPAQ